MDVPFKEAKNRLAEFARRVEAGATIKITRNGVPIADVVPHGATAESITKRATAI
jgi:prevent-host-death family protein